MLLETGGEVAGIFESDTIGQVADTDLRTFLGNTTGFLHADVANETRHIEAGDRAQLIV